MHTVIPQTVPVERETCARIREKVHRKTGTKGSPASGTPGRLENTPPKGTRMAGNVEKMVKKTTLLSSEEKRFLGF